MGSLAQTIQKSQQMAVEGAQFVAGPESVQALPGSIAVGSRGRVVINQPAGDVSSSSTTDALKSILANQEINSANLLGSFQESLKSIFGQTSATSKTITESTQSAMQGLSDVTQALAAGDTSKLSTYAPALIIVGLLLYFVLRK